MKSFLSSLMVERLSFTSHSDCVSKGQINGAERKYNRPFLDLSSPLLLRAHTHMALSTSVSSCKSGMSLPECVGYRQTPSRSSTSRAMHYKRHGNV